MTVTMLQSRHYTHQRCAGNCSGNVTHWLPICFELQLCVFSAHRWKVINLRYHWMKRIYQDSQIITLWWTALMHVRPTYSSACSNNYCVLCDRVYCRGRRRMVVTSRDTHSHSSHTTAVDGSTVFVQDCHQPQQLSWSSERGGRWGRRGHSCAVANTRPFWPAWYLWAPHEHQSADWKRQQYWPNCWFRWDNQHDIILLFDKEAYVNEEHALLKPTVVYSCLCLNCRNCEGFKVTKIYIISILLWCIII